MRFCEGFRGGHFFVFECCGAAGGLFFADFAFGFDVRLAVGFAFAFAFGAGVASAAWLRGLQTVCLVALN
jgi:hypothetical protein